jgi:hypothetical protein
LIAAFSRLLEAALTNKKFCFFIDGLDEYDGDHFDLIKIMFKTIKSPHIKICLSSRPWNCFEDAFGKDLHRKLYLQDLTREDIEIYAQEKLTMPRYMPLLGKDKILYQQLIVDIGDRTQGVFLWVYLVVRSLREGLADGDDVKMLQKRLHSLPTDLELYFKHILASVDLTKEKVGSIFLAAVEANEPLPLMVHAFMDENNPNVAIGLPVNSITDGEVLDRQKLMRSRINSCTNGLLEITGSKEDSPYPLWEVDFLHRTVRDFLRTKSIEAILKDMAAPAFNVHRSLSRALLAAFKTKLLEPWDQSWMDRVAHFARRAEEADKIPDQDMMEQLEHVCKTRSHIFSSSDISFLVFAIQSGLVCYVASTLDQRPELLTLYGADLLAAALPMSEVKASLSLITHQWYKCCSSEASARI